MEPGDTAKYLGVQIGPWSRPWPSIQPVVRRLTTYCESFDKVALKPRQRVHILVTYVAPRIAFEITEGGYSRTQIRAVDMTIRNYVRKWLFLPTCLSNAFLYTRRGEGGLGLVSFYDYVLTERMHKLVRVCDSEDPVIGEGGLGLVSFYDYVPTERMRKLVRVCDLEDPVIAGAAASLGLREKAAKIGGQTGLPVRTNPK